MGIGYFLSALVGAGMMYFLDPERGIRRRASLRDQLDSLRQTTGDRVEDLTEDLSDRVQDVSRRAQDVIAETKRQVNAATSDAAQTVGQTAEQMRDRAEQAVDQVVDQVTDDVLVARVRAEMMDYIAHPEAVEVVAEDGVVRLNGNILANEMDPFIAHLHTVPGVRRVENWLLAHDTASGIPSAER